MADLVIRSRRAAVYAFSLVFASGGLRLATMSEVDAAPSNWSDRA